MAAYPALSRGAIIQYPNGEDDVLTSISDYLDCGQGTFRCTSAYVDSDGVQHLATQRRFRLTYDSISAADVVILEGFFSSMRGRLGTFSFVDDDGTTWAKCVFDQDSLEFKYAQKDQYSVDVQILAITTLSIPALPGESI